MLLINIDGPDGVGKSTVINELIKKFSQSGKILINSYHFPRYHTKVGESIRSALHDEYKCTPRAMQMLNAVDRENFTMFDLPILQKNYDILLVDRYYTSSLVYGTCSTVSKEEIKIFEENVKMPNLTIILNADIDTLMFRLFGKPHDNFENKAFLSKVIKIYNNLEKLDKRLNGRVKYINAKHSLDFVVNEAYLSIMDLCESKGILKGKL